VVLEAVKQNGGALVFASEELQGDCEVRAAAALLFQTGFVEPDDELKNVEEALGFASEEL